MLSFFILCAFFIDYNPVLSYTCSTPDEWMYNTGRESNAQFALTQGEVSASNKRLGGKWPSGIVKYKLNSSLTGEDKKQVFAAFDEYHSKTCVRFEPYKVGDTSYTSIEVDDDVCGLAHVCMKRGYQFTRFGSTCRDKKTMIHELGHTLCLGHEHQRSDRDDYVSYIYCNLSDSNISKKMKGYKPTGIYDYSSQMHYECGINCLGGRPINQYVTECGPQKTEGLSVLDVDTINQMYNCQGCYRHRWIPIHLLKKTSFYNDHLYNFGFYDVDEGPIYPCRARVNNEISVGKFEFKNKVCSIPFAGLTYMVTKDFEVLTIPGGLKNEDSEYALVEFDIWKSNSSRSQLLFKHAVVAGELDVLGRLNPVYIVYATLTEFTKKCNFSGPSENVDVIGKIYSGRSGYLVSFPACYKEHLVQNFFVLTCLKRNRLENDYLNSLVIRHIKNYAGRKLFPGSNITLLLQLPNDATKLSIVLSKEKTGGMVPLEFVIAFLERVIYIGSRSFKSSQWERHYEGALDKFYEFQRGTIFKLFISCDQAYFRIIVDNTTVSYYPYEVSLKNVNFVVIKGDIEVIEVNNVNVQEENGFYRSSFSNLAKYFPSLDITTQENATFSGEEAIDITTQKNSRSLREDENLLFEDFQPKLPNARDKSLGANDQEDDFSKLSFYFVLGIGFSIIVLGAVVLGIILGKSINKKPNYNDVPVIFINK